MKRDHWILLVLAGGFVMTFLEVRVLHGDVVREEAAAWIPLVVTPILAVACLLAMAKARALRGLAAVVLALGVLAGFIGFYKHTEGLKPGRIAPLFSAQPLVAKADEGEEEAREASGNQGAEGSQKEGAKSEEIPPPLAPMGIAGLALIGLIVASKREP